MYLQVLLFYHIFLYPNTRVAFFFFFSYLFSLSISPTQASSEIGLIAINQETTWVLRLEQNPDG